jgi:hypothetical protein
MKTDRERVDELTATLFAQFLKDRYKMALGGKSEAEILRKARGDAWRIVRASDNAALTRNAAMEETRMFPKDKKGTWGLARRDLVGLILQSPGELWWRPDDTLPPHHITARDYVAFYGTQLGSAADVAAFTALPKPKEDLAEDTRRWKKARAGAFRDAAELLRNLAGLYAKAGPTGRHMTAGVLHAADRLEAMANNELDVPAPKVEKVKFSPCPKCGAPLVKDGGGYPFTCGMCNTRLILTGGLLKILLPVDAKDEPSHKPEIWCDGRRVCPDCQIKMDALTYGSDIALGPAGTWRCSNCGWRSKTRIAVPAMLSSSASTAAEEPTAENLAELAKLAREVHERFERPTPGQGFQACPRCGSGVKDPSHCPVCARCPQCGQLEEKGIAYSWGLKNEATCGKCGAKWDPATNPTLVQPFPSSSASTAGGADPKSEVYGRCPACGGIAFTIGTAGLSVVCDRCGIYLYSESWTPIDKRGLRLRRVIRELWSALASEATVGKHGGVAFGRMSAAETYQSYKTNDFEPGTDRKAIDWKKVLGT